MSFNLNNQIQLITYPDSLGKNLKELKSIMDKYLKPVIGGVHILPFYPSSSDRGFSPLTHSRVLEKFGTWEDVEAIAKDYDLQVDQMVNHISAQSKQFQDFLKHSSRSRYSNFFIDSRDFSKRDLGNKLPPVLKQVFHFFEKYYSLFRYYDPFFHKHGVNRRVLAKTYRPRPGSPFVKFDFADGKSRYIWCTFSPDQIDMNIKSRAVRNKLKRDVQRLAAHGAKIIRLDALGYVGKRRGTKNFLIKDTINLMKWLANIAHENGAYILPEVRYHYTAQINLSKTPGVDLVYDFATPFLVLNALATGDVSHLKNWIKLRPNNSINVLDTHDGIGVVDVEGLLPKNEVDKTLQMIYMNGGNAAYRASGKNSKNVDVYQINCTYYNALGMNDDAYICARTLQFFLPGIPQIYYVGLLAGENDIDRLNQTGIGRDVNRHSYTDEEVRSGLEKPVVKRLFKLMRLRNSHPAFDGSFRLADSDKGKIKMAWRKGEASISCIIDLKKYRTRIRYTNKGKKKEEII